MTSTLKMLMFALVISAVSTSATTKKSEPKSATKSLSKKSSPTKTSIKSGKTAAKPSVNPSAKRNPASTIQPKTFAPSPARSAHLTKIRLACMKNLSLESKKHATAICACIERRHGHLASDTELGILVKVFNGSREFEGPKVADSTRALLKANIDTISNCQAKPTWRAK